MDSSQSVSAPIASRPPPLVPVVLVLVNNYPLHAAVDVPDDLDDPVQRSFDDRLNKDFDQLHPKLKKFMMALVAVSTTNTGLHYSVDISDDFFY